MKKVQFDFYLAKEKLSFILRFSVECLYSNTSHLEVHFPPVIIFPGEKKEAEICFYPRDAKLYNEQVTFEINSLSVIQINICGQGTEMMVLHLLFVFFIFLLVFIFSLL